MARLTDPEILTCYKNALSNWRYRGFVELRKDAVNGLKAHLPGFTEEEFLEVLHGFVFLDNGKIDQVAEEREVWRQTWSHHYDIRPTIGGKKFYVETRLAYGNPADLDDPRIFVVNLKPA